MDVINYDFSAFINIFNRMRHTDTVTPNDLTELKTELNSFFKDSRCNDVLYTTNVDNMFFGVKVLPVINPDDPDIYDLLSSEEPHRISTYILEIDSKLLDPVMNLGSYQLLAIILHEVNALVGDSTPMDYARNALNTYLAANREHIKITQSIHYKEILCYGLKDYLSKCRSMFYTNDETEIAGDTFANSYGLSSFLLGAYKKVNRNNIKLYENAEVSKFITFSWTLSVYRNLAIRRIGALKVLSRAKQLTGSKLEKIEIENVIRRIHRIDDNALVESTSVLRETLNIRSKIREKLRKSRLNTLKSIDSIYYELNMQVRNVEDENDALYIMRQINNNLAIVDEYRNSPDIDPAEKDKWNDIYDRFIKLRESLSSTVVYKAKNYGIFVQYPDIVPDRYN